MPSRRQLLFMAGAALGLTPALGCVGNPGASENQMTTDIRFPVQKTDAEWRETLSPEQYKVLREHVGVGFAPGVLPCARRGCFDGKRRRDVKQ